MPLGMISALTSFTCFRDFLIIGCGLSSSSEKARVRGSKSRPEDAIEKAEKSSPIGELVKPLLVLVLGNESQTKCQCKYLLESAGESGGLMVSGLMQSEGEGDRSLLVTGACRPSARPAPAPNAEPPRCAPPSASPGMPFSDRNSSKSTYCNTNVTTSQRQQ